MLLTHDEAIGLLADSLALVYHEARHVRHLIQKGYRAAEGWERLRALPSNRVEAWRLLLDVRRSAASAGDADEAATCFERRFGKSLSDLADLFADEHWKHASAVGGHAWRHVTTAVTDLRDAIAPGSLPEVEEAARRVLGARHNNGAIRDKIANLDHRVEAPTGRWWRMDTG